MDKKWWMERTKRLRELNKNNDIDTLIYSIEYFPYHSVKFNHKALGLPSQEKIFKEVDRCVKKNKIIIISRGERIWKSAVHSLIGYKNIIKLNSIQNFSLSKNNIKSDDWEKIVKAISK